MLDRTPTRLALILLAVVLCVQPGCTTTSGPGGGGGMHLPRPVLRASTVQMPRLEGPATHADNAVVEILAVNPTDAPLWIRRLSMTLAADDRQLAAGNWEGDREIDPGTSVLLEVSLPMVEGAALPGVAQGGPQDGLLTVETRYARSGLIGLMGGESHRYQLPVRIERP